MPSKLRINCIHCGRNDRNYGRGLCQACTRKPGIRELYPTGRKRAKNTTREQRLAAIPVRPDANNRAPAVPKKPTAARPGSEGKLAVMADRLARGEALFHPSDFVFAPEGDL